MKPFKNLLLRFIYGVKATPKTYARHLKKHCLFFGEGVYLTNPHKTIIDKDALQFIHIGNYVQILSGVTILAHDESYSVCGHVYKAYPRKQKITYVGDNVFIGMNSTILMGSHIGANTIIGAGSVVSGLVESESVYAGNPARRIMSLKEYFDFHMEQFESSAYLYFKNFLERKGRFPLEKEQHMYSLLFENQRIEASSNKPKQLVDEINATYKRKYKSMDDFMNNFESGRIK